MTRFMVGIDWFPFLLNVLRGRENTFWLHLRNQNRIHKPYR